MKKYLMATAVAMSLGAVPAFAQSTTTTPATPPSSSSTTTPAASATATGDMWYSNTNQANEMRASKLIGTKVRNSAGDNIGDVNDVLLSSDGRANAVVIGVGGFLGIGERNVAVKYDALRFGHDSSGNAVVSMNVDKATLQSAPAWTWSNSNASGSATTGTSTGTSSSTTNTR